MFQAFFWFLIFSNIWITWRQYLRKFSQMFYLHVTKHGGKHQQYFLIRNENITEMLNSYFTQNLEEYAKSENDSLWSDCISKCEHRVKNSIKVIGYFFVSKTVKIIFTLLNFYLNRFLLFSNVSASNLTFKYRVLSKISVIHKRSVKIIPVQDR